MIGNKHAAGRRPGFTVVELLVVVAIIGVLASLSAAAYFKLIGTKQRDITEDTIRIVYKVLEQQMRIVAAQADKETIPASVLNGLAGGDMKRARVIWKELRHKQEFPMSYWEAYYPWTLANGTILLPATDLPGKTVYTRNIPAPSTKPGNKPPAPGASESSACLLLALGQNRKGVVLNLESLPTNAIADTDNDGLKEIIDGWGTPLAYYRWPTSSSGNQPPNPAAGNPRGQRFADPLDPDGQLLNPAWYTSVKPNFRLPFEAICHTVSPDNGQTAYYVVPVLVSAGRDNAFGLLPPPDTTMTIDIPNAAKVADNIYSYQLKLGAAGIAP